MSNLLERRTAILRAAARLFEHYGPAKTTVADVAREAQIGVGSVYLEFPSKEAMLAAIAGTMHEQLLEKMRRAARAERSADAQLRAVLLVRTRQYLELKQRSQHACDLVHCKSVQGTHAAFRAAERSLFRELVADGMARDVFAAGDPDVIAMLVQRTFVSLTPPWLFEVPCETDALEKEAPRLVDGLCALVLDGLRSRKKRRP